MIKQLSIVFLIFCVLSISRGAAAQGTATISSSLDANPGVKLVVSIQDPATLNCPWIGVIRGSVSDLSSSSHIVDMIRREPGTTYTVETRDLNAQPNTVYCYRLAPMQNAWYPDPSGWCSFCDLFDCSCEVQTCIDTGAQPILIGHGRIYTWNASGALVGQLFSCENPAQPMLSFGALSGTALQYANTDVDVLVYGATVNGQCYAWSATAAIPQSCTLATEQKTWGAVKAIYRE